MSNEWRGAGRAAHRSTLGRQRLSRQSPRGTAGRDRTPSEPHLTRPRPWLGSETQGATPYPPPTAGRASVGCGSEGAGGPRGCRTHLRSSALRRSAPSNPSAAQSSGLPRVAGRRGWHGPRCGVRQVRQQLPRSAPRASRCPDPFLADGSYVQSPGPWEGYSSRRDRSRSRQTVGFASPLVAFSRSALVLDGLGGAIPCTS